MAYVSNIDAEWADFMSSNYDDDSVSDDELSTKYVVTGGDNFVKKNELTGDIPISTEIYISTKSKIAYLNQGLDLDKIFWDIKTIPYSTPSTGVIKKQMKFNSTCQEQLDVIEENLKGETYFDSQVLTSINNPNGRIKFKDIRKISIGISKKDILSYRCKRKSAFYNCFVMILRIKIGCLFKEFHIKVFNTGKMEIPGIQNDAIYEEVLKSVLLIIQPHVDDVLEYKQTSDTILINSNFNSGYYINREALFDLLKYTYNIQCIYDPCSYPGVQCKFYYDKEVSLENQTGSLKSGEEKSDKIVTVSFMIFRTGSILIVGMCDDDVLYGVYEFLKKMLTKEYYVIRQENVGNIEHEDALSKNKKKKVRRKTIMVDV